ncbi:hypothetical protein KSP40_PGU022268 [Platanthera guangdongensis]|uniref:Uncharacterized protein n=1 Tax=Platanthera guangdongensis TaxID=2320717 RepID=A0ABR2N5V5_9ASPA
MIQQTPDKIIVANPRINRSQGRSEAPARYWNTSSPFQPFHTPPPPPFRRRRRCLRNHRRTCPRWSGCAHPRQRIRSTPGDTGTPPAAAAGSSFLISATESLVSDAAVRRDSTQSRSAAPTRPVLPRWIARAAVEASLILERLTFAAVTARIKGYGEWPRRRESGRCSRV